MSNQLVNWGILSTARIGVRSFIPSAQLTPHAKVLAVASRDQQRAETFARKYNIPVALGSYQALLDREDIHAIYNPLPNNLHPEWTIRAAKAGKHVFCEKPLAITSIDGQKMVEACKSSGVLLFEAFVFLHHPQSCRIRKILNSEELGPLRHISSGMTFNLQDRTDIRMFKELGGGSIYDGGVYPITFSRFIVGADPISVHAIMNIDEESGVDLRTVLILEYPNKVTATLYSAFDSGGSQHARVECTNGLLDIPSPFHPRETSTFDVVTRKQANTEIRSEAINSGVPPFQPAIESIQKFIRGEQVPSFTADYAIGTLKIVESAFESARLGRKVYL